ncbi:MAG TPA: hypothetical protein VGG77_07555 [Roseiarcus sp.]
MSAVSTPTPTTRVSARAAAWSLVRRLRQTLGAGLLDLLDLPLDEAQAVQVTSHLGQCVGRYRDALRRAQGVKLAWRPSQIGPEAANANGENFSLVASV